MNTFFSFELSTATSFAAPGKGSHRLLMDGFKNTTVFAEEDDTPKTGDRNGDRDIPVEKDDLPVKDKV